MTDLPGDLLDPFEPDPDRLLDWLRLRVDEGMLREMSRADYGEDAKKHLRELRRICDTCLVPAPLEWVPKEVLELIHWSQPEDPDWGPGGHGERGHLMRAFACAALLRAADHSENAPNVLEENSTLAQLLDSAEVLGREAQKAAASFLAWRIPRLGIGDERPFFAFALLLLAVSLRRSRGAQSDLARLADWVVADEAKERAELGTILPPHGSQWLLGLTFHDLRHDVWRSLAARLRDQAAEIGDPDVQLQLESIAGRILGPES